jgi:hypothetical protein
MQPTELGAKVPLWPQWMSIARPLATLAAMCMTIGGPGWSLTAALGQEGWVASSLVLTDRLPPEPAPSTPLQPSTDLRSPDLVPASTWGGLRGFVAANSSLASTPAPLSRGGVVANPASMAVELPPAPLPNINEFQPGGLSGTINRSESSVNGLTGQSMPMLSSQPTTQTVYVPGDGLTVSMLNRTSEVKLFGQFSTIGIFSTSRVFAAGLPLVVLPPSPSGLNTNTFDLHARQTAFGASFRGAEVLGFTPGATFLGFIQNDNLTSDAYGFLPYQAYGELKNESWRIAAGLQSDVFNPGKPTIISLASLFGSGNVGSFRGQFRVERFLSPTSDRQVTLQLALSEPIATIVTNNTRIVEDNGWPNVEGRVGLGLGTPQTFAGSRNRRRVEAGVSGVVGQLRTSRLITAPTDPDVPNRAIIDTWGLGVDLGLAVTDRLGFTGELFMGQGLGEYNGGVLQSFNTARFNPIRSKGGWGEIYYYLTDSLHVHSGYGIDVPERGDLAAAQFAKNQTYFTNMVWDASKTVQLSFEVDYRETNYVGLEDANAMLFLSQLLLKF